MKIALKRARSARSCGHSMRLFAPVLLCASFAAAFAQQPVTIRVDASRRLGSFKPVWNFFGYDEPNYTYTENGSRLIRELAELSETPVQIRTHNLLTTGSGMSGLKWGSTNAYTEDASGGPVYDWTLTDKIFDTYLRAGAKPFVEIGFMPKALSSQPEPYAPVWKTPADFGKYFLGWSYPPKDYQKWSELVYQWVEHCSRKYGKSEVETWSWEVWNEPISAIGMARLRSTKNCMTSLLRR